MTSGTWISTFLEAQAAELGAARNTLLAYGRDLIDAQSWLEQQDTGFATATQSDIEAYLIHCDAQGLAKSTRARRLSAIKQLFRFAFEEGWRSENPAIQIASPGQDKRLPKTLDEAEVDSLLTAARTFGRNPKAGRTALPHLPWQRRRKRNSASRKIRGNSVNRFSAPRQEWIRCESPRPHCRRSSPL